MNVFNFVIDLWGKLCNLVDFLYNFLFTELNLGFTTISVWALLGGAGLLALIIYSIAK